jgi:DNA primase
MGLCSAPSYVEQLSSAIWDRISIANHIQEWKMSDAKMMWETYKQRIRDATDFIALAEEKVGHLERRPTEHSPVVVRCPWHDDRTPSLAVYPDHATCFGACGQTWDLFGWAMKVWEMDFTDARDELARRAGIPRPPLSPGNANAATEELRREDGLAIVARYFSDHLWATPAALDYAHSRGWNDETLRAERVGCATGDDRALVAALQAAGLPVSHPAAQVARRISEWAGRVAGALVYVHRQGHQVVYLSARSIEGKQHYNPPAELAGPRHPYLNARYDPQAALVVVEGQADAISLSQWGLPALALAGCSANESLVERLRQHPGVWLALDADPAGRDAARPLASRLGPLTRLLTWPGAARDANDALRDGVTAEQVQTAQQNAPEWVEVLAQEATQASGLDRDTALRTCFQAVAQLDSFALSARRNRLAQTLNLGLREFDRLVTSVSEEQEALSSQDSSQPLTVACVPGGYMHRSDVLFEMAVTQEESPRSLFAVRWSDGRISLEQHLDLDGVRYVPLDPALDLICKGVVLFPSAVGDYEHEIALQAEVQAFIHRYLDVDAFYEKMASYYVLFSWHYDSFNVLPYLRALGDYGTGKTRFLQVIGVLCYRPMFAGGASTTSPLFRIIDRMRGTLILDEADFVASDAEVDIVKILNCGYMAGFPVLRTVKDGDDFEVAAMEVFGPKVMATRRRYTDKALESRMLTHEMRGGQPRSDIPIVLPREFHAQALDLRNKLLRYRLAHWQPDREVDLSGLDHSIEPRLNQVTLALLTIVRDEELRGDIRSFIRDYNRQLIVDRSMTLEALALDALVRLHDEKRQQGVAEPLISLNDLAGRVNEALAAESGEGEESAKVTAKKVGHILRERLQLRTEKQSGRYHIVWDDERIQALKVRYGLEIAPPA